LALASLALAGCDRIPLDPIETELLVTPDLSVVFLDPTFSLRLTPDGPSRPLEVRIRDKEVHFDSTQGIFLYERELSRGLNVFPLSVTDEEGEVRLDTLYALYLPIERVPLLGVDAGVPRAGAAVTALGLEGLLVSGGAAGTGAARATASRIQIVNAQVQSEEVPLVAARVGHTATAVAGGALLLGGATTLSPDGPSGFVRQAEWVGPDGSSRALTIADGDAGPARMGHVARAVTADGETFVYLLGGRVPTATGAAVSETVDVFRVVGIGAPEGIMSLERLSPEGGASGFAALADATLAPTGAATAAVFGMSGAEATALTLAWSLPGTGTFPFSLRVAPAGALQTPRSRAAAVDLGRGLALVLGGRDADGRALGTLEVYAAEANRAFRFPEIAPQLAVPRAEHVATILQDGRIVVIGGRPASGGPIVAAEAFRL